MIRMMNLVQEYERQTDIRLKLLANGYRPIPTCEKVAFQTGWPTMPIDKQVIKNWPMTRAMGGTTKPAVTTAIQLTGTMLAIDVDIQDTCFSDEVEGLLHDEFGRAFHLMPFRMSGGPKFMVLCRTETPFEMWRTAKYRDEEGLDHQVEVYGGGSTRYFSCFGPHTLGDIVDGEYQVVKEYTWIPGCENPLAVSPDELPLVTDDQLKTFMMKVSDLLDETGWEKIKMRNEVSGGLLYDLTEDMVFETKDGNLSYWEAVAYALTERDARCSASVFRQVDSGNTSKCRMRAIGDDEAPGLQVFDHEEWVTHLPASAAPRTQEERTDALEDLGAALVNLDLDLSEDDLDRIDGRALRSFEDKVSEMLETLAFDYREGLYHWRRRGMVWSGVKRATLMANLRDFDLTWEGPRGGRRKLSVVDTWEKQVDRLQIAGVRFRPDQGPVFDLEGETYLNGFFGLDENPSMDREAHDVLMAFLDHLVPDTAERLWLMDWLAAKYRNPWERNCAVVFVAPGVQGAGRGTFFSILDTVFDGYTSTVSETDLVSARFNSFMENNLLLFCNELGGLGWSERKRGYETLKDRVDPSHTQISIERKRVEAYRTETFVSFLLATNQPGALTIDPEDRRFAFITNGEKLEGRLLERVLEVGKTRLGLVLRNVLHRMPVGQDVSDAPMFAGREAMLLANDTDLDAAIQKIVDEAGPERAWIRSDFEKAIKLEMTGSSNGKVPGLRQAVSNLVGKRADRVGAELLQERMKVGDRPLAVVAKSRSTFVAHSPEDRVNICKGVNVDADVNNIVPLR